MAPNDVVQVSDSAVATRRTTPGWPGSGRAFSGQALFVLVVSVQSLLPASAQEPENGFELSCAAAVSEGGTLTCTLTNSADEAAGWPVIAILHLSSDSNRALVRGSPLDLRFGTPVPDATVDGGLWWIGDVLVGYSRFDWSEVAEAEASRSVSIVVEDDDDHEGEEVFFVSLAPSGTRGVGSLYTNRQKVTVAASDSANTDARLKALEISTDAGAVPLEFFSDTTAYEASVVYRATEAVVTPVVNHEGATVSVGGVGVESGENSRAVSLGEGSTAIEVVVTAESGATQTYRIGVTRAALLSHKLQGSASCSCAFPGHGGSRWGCSRSLSVRRSKRLSWSSRISLSLHLRRFENFR